MEMVLVVLLAVVLMWRLQQEILRENEELVQENQWLQEQIRYQQRAIRQLQEVKNGRASHQTAPPQDLSPSGEENVLRLPQN